MIINHLFIGQRIKDSRCKLRITQASLAEKIGVSDTFISRIETGAKRASLETLIKASIVLDILIDDLVFDDWISRLPEGYREMCKLLEDCDKDEIGKILEVAITLKYVLREEKKMARK